MKPVLIFRSPLLFIISLISKCAQEGCKLLLETIKKDTKVHGQKKSWCIWRGIYFIYRFSCDINCCYAGTYVDTL